MRAGRLAMSLPPPLKVQKLQEALHAKAKGSPDYRFYALYDKVYRRDILEFAYARCRANGGAPGIDHQKFEDIETYGLERWLDELATELKGRTYQSRPVRRVYIPKPDGKQRPLGIATIRDRVVQMAVVLVLEPIFEADLEPEQYAYRANRSALDAVRAAHGLLNAGHRQGQRTLKCWHQRTSGEPLYEQGRIRGFSRQLGDCSGSTVFAALPDRRLVLTPEIRAFLGLLPGSVSSFPSKRKCALALAPGRTRSDPLVCGAPP